MRYARRNGPSLDPGLGSFAEYSAAALGHWAGFMNGWLYWYFWVITVGVETIAGATLLSHWIAAPVWVIGLVLIMAMTATNLLSGAFVWRVRILVRLPQGRLHRPLHRPRPRLRLWLSAPAPSAAAHVLTGHGGLIPARPVRPVPRHPDRDLFHDGQRSRPPSPRPRPPTPPAISPRSARTVSLRILVFYVASIAVIVSIVPWDSIMPAESPFTRTMNAMHIPGAVDRHAGDRHHRGALLPELRPLRHLGAWSSSSPAAATPPPSSPASPKTTSPRLGILLGSTVGFLAALASIFSPHAGLPVPDQHLRRHHPLHLFADRRRRNPHAPKPGACRRTLETENVVLSGAKLPCRSRDCRGFVMMAFAPGQFIQVAASTFSVAFIYGAFCLRRRLG